MSKGNLFLGLGRGSVGDVTLYRSNGEQVARSRNRHPKYSNSTKQAVQRAVTASVSRLYSLMQTLCNHSFQRESAGFANQRAFTKANAGILRSLIISDLNDNKVGAAAAARISAPGVSVAVPFAGALISSGNYAQLAFAWVENSHAYQLPTAGANETVAEYVARVGLIAGDIYTIGVVNVNPSSNPVYTVGAGADAYGSVYQSKMTYMQLMVKDGLAGDTSAMAGKTLGDIFSYVGGNSDATGYEYNDALTISVIDTDNQEWSEGCIFCIRSRWDADLRSTSYLMPAKATQAYGLSTDKLLSAWRDREGLTDVELILEGQQFDGISGITKYPLSQLRISNPDLRNFGKYVPAWLVDTNTYVVPYVLGIPEEEGDSATTYTPMKAASIDDPKALVENLQYSDMMDDNLAEMESWFNASVGLNVTFMEVGSISSNSNILAVPPYKSQVLAKTE